MRGRSVVGPLILILLGAVFLINNVRPDLNLFTFIANYWPFLLIAWGGLRLLEIMTWAATSKPLPRSGISAGEWVVVIFLCIIGSAMWLASASRLYQTPVFRRRPGPAWCVPRTLPNSSLPLDT